MKAGEPIGKQALKKCLIVQVEQPGKGVCGKFGYGNMAELRKGIEHRRFDRGAARQGVVRRERTRERKHQKNHLDAISLTPF